MKIASNKSLRRSVCVLVPALDEAENIRPTTETLLRALSETTDEFEIIIVDDGSTDGTGAIADQLAAVHPAVRVFHNERNLGIGAAYRRGVGEAHCGHFVYIPGDNTWPYHSCRQLFSALGKADVITSYPLNPHARPLGRRILSPLYTWSLNAIFCHAMRYYNGLNIYPTSFLRAHPVSTSGFAFQAEVLLKALAAGLSYTEVGLAIDERVSGGSKAISPRSFMTVIGTILRLAWELRVKRFWVPAGADNT